MNKTTFLAELEKELTGVTPDERVAALQYYKEYFDDAGPEHEADVLAQLGSPQEIAKDIKASSGEVWSPPEKEQIVPAATQQELPELTPDAPPQASSPFEQAPPQAPPLPPEFNSQQPAQSAQPPAGEQMPPPSNGGWTPPPPYSYTPPAPTTNPSNNSIAKIILLVFAAMFLIPIGGGLLAGLFGVLVGFFVCAITVLFIPFILALTFSVTGIGIIIASIFLLMASPANGLLFLGSGLVLTALGILCGILGVTIFSKVLPPFFRGTINFVRKIFQSISHFFGSLFGSRTN